MQKYFIILCCLFPTVCFGQTPVQSSDLLVVIANKNNSSLTVENVYMLYAMKQHIMPSQSRAVLLVQPLSSDASIRFFDEIFHSFPYQIKRLWDIAIFSGQSKKPILKDNNESVLAYIRQNENALGYVFAKPENIVFLKENYHVIAIYQ